MQLGKPIFTVSPPVGVLNDLYTQGHISYFSSVKDEKNILTTLEQVYKDFKPTKFKIFCIMLLIGIAEWTGGGIGQFIYSSELGTIIKCIKTIMNFHL
jgi:hypothetical protein